VLYTGGEINLALVVAHAVAFIWITMCYGTGLPILYGLTCFFFLIQFWAFFFATVCCFKKSRFLNEELPMMSMSYLKLGLVFHFISTFALLLDNSLLPVPDYTKVFYNNDYNTFSEFVDKIIYEIQIKSHIQIYFYSGVAIAAAYLLGRIALMAIARLRTKNSEMELTGETTDILKDMSIQNLHHLYVKSQNELRSQRELTNSQDIIDGYDF